MIYAAAISDFEEALTRIAPFMMPSFARQRATFGHRWIERFGETLTRFIARTDSDLDAAVRGYVNFALDGMRLSRQFEKTHRYESKSYEEASAKVYQNEKYMLELYLPGILLSHYLWPHHYRQFQFFEREFVPLFRAAHIREFCDIGSGTGFYSRLLLNVTPDARCSAFDISPSSLEYSRRQVAAFGVDDRWNMELRDVVARPPERQWPFLVCIEVLEHLEDPLGFLRALQRMLSSGGKGLISAAITAPNADHIYLYRNSAEVREQLLDAGFTVSLEQEDRAYEPKGSEPVPTNAVFIVSS